MKQVVPKPFFAQTCPTHSFQIPEIYVPFQNKKSLMKPDTFLFKFLPTFPATPTPLQLTSHSFKLKTKKKKNPENSFCHE